MIKKIIIYPHGKEGLLVAVKGESSEIKALDTIKIPLVYPAEIEVPGEI